MPLCEGFLWALGSVQETSVFSTVSSFALSCFYLRSVLLVVSLWIYFSLGVHPHKNNTFYLFAWIYFQHGSWNWEANNIFFSEEKKKSQVCSTRLICTVCTDVLEYFFSFLFIMRVPNDAVLAASWPESTWGYIIRSRSIGNLVIQSLFYTGSWGSEGVNSLLTISQRQARGIRGKATFTLCR